MIRALLYVLTYLVGFGVGAGGMYVGMKLGEWIYDIIHGGEN